MEALVGCNHWWWSGRRGLLEGWPVVGAGAWQMLLGLRRRGEVCFGPSIVSRRVSWRGAQGAVCGGVWGGVGGCRSCHSLGVECSALPRGRSCGPGAAHLCRIGPAFSGCQPCSCCGCSGFAFRLKPGVCFWSSAKCTRKQMGSGLHIVACAATLGCDLVI